MKTSILSFAAALGLASAQYTVVENHCDQTFYIESFPYDSHAPGVLYTVKPGEYFKEAFRYYGTSVKISKTKTFDNPLLVDYSFSNDHKTAYYSFNSKFGNPVANKHNTLGAGDGCKAFNCAANDAACYSRNGDKVYACPQPVNITAKLCV